MKNLKLRKRQNSKKKNKFPVRQRPKNRVNVPRGLGFANIMDPLRCGGGGWGVGKELTRPNWRGHSHSGHSSFPPLRVTGAEIQSWLQSHFHRLIPQKENKTITTKTNTIQTKNRRYMAPKRNTDDVYFKNHTFITQGCPLGISSHPSPSELSLFGPTWVVPSVILLPVSLVNVTRRLGQESSGHQVGHGRTRLTRTALYRLLARRGLWNYITNWLLLGNKFLTVPLCPVNTCGSKAGVFVSGIRENLFEKKVMWKHFRSTMTYTEFHKIEMQVTARWFSSMHANINNLISAYFNHECMTFDKFASVLTLWYGLYFILREFLNIYQLLTELSKYVGHANKPSNIYRLGKTSLNTIKH